MSDFAQVCNDLCTLLGWHHTEEVEGGMVILYRSPDFLSPPYKLVATQTDGEIRFKTKVGETMVYSVTLERSFDTDLAARSIEAAIALARRVDDSKVGGIL